MKKGNFRLDDNGNIEYYVGWCNLEYQDIEDLKYILAEKNLLELWKRVKSN